MSPRYGEEGRRSRARMLEMTGMQSERSFCHLLSPQYREEGRRSHFRFAMAIAFPYNFTDPPQSSRLVCS
ncbi:MAG: hypothetical protein AB4290_01815 [Spirulina sp.]